MFINIWGNTVTLNRCLTSVVEHNKHLELVTHIIILFKIYLNTTKRQNFYSISFFHGISVETKPRKPEINRYIQILRRLVEK